MKCLKCNNYIKPYYRYCNNCGTDLTLVNKNNNKNLILFICLSIISSLFISICIIITPDESINEQQLQTETSKTTNIKFSTDTTLINYLGYYFNIPDEYTYATSDDSLILSDNQNWYVKINLIVGNFDKQKQDITNFKNILLEQGLTISNTKQDYYNGLELITFEVTTNDNNHIYAFGKASDTRIYYIDATDTFGSIDYNVFDSIAPILLNITKVNDKTI